MTTFAIMTFLSSDTLREVLVMLETSNHPQVDYICRAMRKWAKENKIDYV